MSDAWEERVVRTDKDPITYESPVTEHWNFQEVPCNVDRLLLRAEDIVPLRSSEFEKREVLGKAMRHAVNIIV